MHETMHVTAADQDQPAHTGATRAAAQPGATHDAAPRFTVVKGNPTADELEAIGQVLAQLQAQAKEQESPADRNGWGAWRPAHHEAAPLYNPHAFGTVAYF